MIMELKDVLHFIEMQDERSKRHYNNLDEEKVILARTIKLTEELGELCQEVLAHYSLQREQKLNVSNEKKLSEEFADVLITTLLLAKSMDVSVEKALENKIEKICKRSEGI